MKSILLVDDEPEAVSIFKTSLISKGYIVTVAKDAKSALELSQDTKFDLILLDEMMPDMSGNELIKILKKTENYATVPVIILTNYSDDELVKTALSAGANDYILKYQMVPDDLAEKVRKLVGE